MSDCNNCNIKCYNTSLKFNGKDIGEFLVTNRKIYNDDENIVVLILITNWIYDKCKIVGFEFSTIIDNLQSIQCIKVKTCNKSYVANYEQIGNVEGRWINPEIYTNNNIEEIKEIEFCINPIINEG